MRAKRIFFLMLLPLLLAVTILPATAQQPTKPSPKAGFKMTAAQEAQLQKTALTSVTMVPGDIYMWVRYGWIKNLLPNLTIKQVGYAATLTVGKSYQLTSDHRLMEVTTDAPPVGSDYYLSARGSKRQNYRAGK